MDTIRCGIQIDEYGERVYVKKCNTYRLVTKQHTLKKGSWAYELYTYIKETFGDKTFSSTDIDNSYFKNKFPNNNTISRAVKTNLQKLRNEGLLLLESSYITTSPPSVKRKSTKKKTTMVHTTKHTPKHKKQKVEKHTITEDHDEWKEKLKLLKNQMKQ